MREQKQRLRVQFRLRGEALPVAEISYWSRLIQQKVLEFPAYRGARAVVLYSPIGNEVATEAIQADALGSGKRLFYPKLGKGKHLDLVRITTTKELRPGVFGILEPTGSEVLAQGDQERLVVFVPGLAFDLQGNRLGRGWGWYDRVMGLLTEGARFVALAYEFQILETLPAGRWDQKVHHIITETRVIDCGQKTAPSGWLS